MRKDYCKFFNGLAYQICDAGVEYHKVSIMNGRDFINFPCSINRAGSTKCRLFKRLTDEEAERYEKERVTKESYKKKYAHKLKNLAKKIKRESRGMDSKDFYRCPICGDKIYAVHLAQNNEVLFACNNPECIQNVSSFSILNPI